ncbi:sensor histidine kinase [Occultella gossypii]|uniref:Sensor-like histidine kinase SenX3 n=1 Tax=Occultella gossypii TaxID=2800820 RepID=A0ABS7SD77_9MICO|nr:ATP-binding protein [Occultella gossypii]MBZ2197201.1 two-component sensor histidine kinase [Occultella gossypii]
MEGSWLPVVVGLVGLLVGAAAGLAFRWSERSQSREPEVPTPAVSDDVAALLSALRSTSVLLGPGGEVLRATPDAYTTGLVRNGRLTHTTLNDLVAAVRADGRIRDEHLDVPRSAVPGADRLSFEVRVAPMAGGRVLLLADDQTAQRRLEEVRRDFVANVSHELKTPVGAIALLAETAADAADDPELVRRFAAKMQREAVRLSALVKEIIELSRLQAPDNEVDFVDVSVDAVVAEAVDRIRVEAESRDITVVVGGTGGLRVFGDHSLLVTAVRNLLDNALRYSENGTRVSVGVRPRDGIAEIAVVDQGPGISSENTGRVFERFFRVDPARSRETGGTGLGLSIVKHVAQNHGGEVTLWSAPGRGSTFTLRIPQAEDHGDGPAPSHDEHAPPASPAGAGGDSRDPHPAR